MPAILNLFNLKNKSKAYGKKAKICSYILTISRNCYHSHRQLYIQEVTEKFIIQLINIIQFT